MIDYRRIGQAFKLGVVFSRGRRLANDERWITYHPNGKENPGRKALIDEDGNILKGGGPFGGMNLKDIPKKAAEIKEQRAKARTEKAGGAAVAGKSAAQRIAGSRNPRGEIDSIRREKAGEILGKAVPGFSTSKTYGNTRESLASLRNQLASAALGGKEPTAEQREKINGAFRKFGLDDDSAGYFEGSNGGGVKGEAVAAAAQELVEQLKTPDEIKAETEASRAARVKQLEREGVFSKQPGWYDTNHNPRPGAGNVLEGGTRTHNGETILKPENALAHMGITVEGDKWRGANGREISPERVAAAKHFLEGAAYNHRDDSFNRNYEMAQRILSGDMSAEQVREITANQVQSASGSKGKSTEALRSDLEKLRADYGSIKPMDYERTRAASAKNLSDLESAVSRVKELAQKADMYDVTKVMDVQNDFKKLEERLSHPLQNDPMAKQYGLENSVFSDDQKQVIRNYFFNKYRDRLAQAEQYLDASGRMKDIQNKALETAQAIRESNGGPSREGASFAEEFGPMSLSDDYRKRTRAYLNGTTTPDELLADVGEEARWRAKSHINETIKKATGQAMKNDWLTFKIDKHEWFYDRGTGRWLEPEEAKSKSAQQSLERARRDAAKKGYADKAVFSFKGKTGSFDWN